MLSVFDFASSDAELTCSMLRRGCTRQLCALRLVAVRSKRTRCRARLCAILADPDALPHVERQTLRSAPRNVHAPRSVKRLRTIGCTRPAILRLKPRCASAKPLQATTAVLCHTRGIRLSFVTVLPVLVLVPLSPCLQRGTFPEGFPLRFIAAAAFNNEVRGGSVWDHTRLDFLCRQHKCNSRSVSTPRLHAYLRLRSKHNNYCQPLVLPSLRHSSMSVNGCRRTSGLSC